MLYPIANSSKLQIRKSSVIRLGLIEGVYGQCRLGMACLYSVYIESRSLPTRKIKVFRHVDGEIHAVGACRIIHVSASKLGDSCS